MRCEQHASETRSKVVLEKLEEAIKQLLSNAIESRAGKRLSVRTIYDFLNHAYATEDIEYVRPNELVNLIHDTLKRRFTYDEVYEAYRDATINIKTKFNAETPNLGALVGHKRKCEQSVC